MKSELYLCTFATQPSVELLSIKEIRQDELNKDIENRYRGFRYIHGELVYAGGKRVEYEVCISAMEKENAKIKAEGVLDRWLEKNKPIIKVIQHNPPTLYETVIEQFGLLHPFIVWILVPFLFFGFILNLMISNEKSN